MAKKIKGLDDVDHLGHWNEHRKQDAARDM